MKRTVDLRMTVCIGDSYDFASEKHWLEYIEDVVGVLNDHCDTTISDHIQECGPTDEDGKRTEECWRTPSYVSFELIEPATP